MKKHGRWTAAGALALAALAGADGRPAAERANPAIDAAGFRRMVGQALEQREARRLTEEEFIRMSREPGTVVLDARSREKYDELHVRGAVNLSFPDVTAAALARVIPSKATRVLIYCNNNFTGDERAFPVKSASAALNLSTYVTLHDYGYRNLYELGPLLDLKSTRLEFESSPR